TFSFKELVAFQMKDIIRTQESKFKEYNSPMPPIKSAINYLLIQSFDKSILDELFNGVALTGESAIELTGRLAGVLLDPEISQEERKQQFDKSITFLLFPHNLLCDKEYQTAEEILTYLTKTLTYAEYVQKASPKTSCLFKNSPSPEDFAGFQASTNV